MKNTGNTKVWKNEKKIIVVPRKWIRGNNKLRLQEYNER
jgi:hypothetical protein